MLAPVFPPIQTSPIKFPAVARVRLTQVELVLQYVFHPLSITLSLTRNPEQSRATSRTESKACMKSALGQNRVLLLDCTTTPRNHLELLVELEPLAAVPSTAGAVR